MRRSRLMFRFSPTGWTAEARDFETGQHDSAFLDPLVNVSLFDENGASRNSSSE